MFRTMLAAVAVIPLLLGVGAPFAAAEDAAPEPPRNRLSPTDDSELPQRTVPPLAPPQPLIQRRISEPPAEEPPPRATPPEANTPPQIKPQPTPQRAMKHRAATQRIATKRAKPPRVMARQAPPPRRGIAARTQRPDDTSLGALFTAGRTPPSRSPEAPPSALTYNYFGTPATRDERAPCPTRSRTSVSALFTCKLR